MIIANWTCVYQADNQSEYDCFCSAVAKYIAVTPTASAAYDQTSLKITVTYQPQEQQCQ